MSAMGDEALRVLAASKFGVPTLVAALAWRLQEEGRDVAVKKVLTLASELAEEYRAPVVRPAEPNGAHRGTG